MAEPKGVAFLPGQDPGTVSANREYQQALERMLATLDARKNRIFDPTLLAMAEGFLKPAPTFGESLGHVAGAVRQSQEREADLDRKLAEAQLTLAGRGLELERQKARERAFQQLGGVGAPPPEETRAGAPGAVPGGASGQAPAGSLTGAGAVAQNVAQAGAGRLAAPDRVLTRREFMALQAGEGVVSPAQAESNWAEYQKRVAETERGRAEAERARSEMGERQIYGSTYRVPIQIARQLDDAQASGDAARYRAVADQFLRGAGAPPRGVAETEIEKAAEMERQKVLAAESATREAGVPRARMDALQIQAASDRIMRDVTMFPKAFGVFEKPGVMAAFATLIDEGLSLGTTRVNMAGFRRAVTQAMPGMSQDAIDALLRFAGNKAEIELLYRRKYLAGQGQGSISNMEQAIIPNLIGSEKDTPQALLDKVRLLSLRAQFDVKVSQKWREMSRANPKLTYLQFEKSDDYQKMEDQYDQVLRGEFAHLAPRSDGAAPARPSGASPAVVPPAAVAPSTSPAVTTPVPATSSGAPQLTATPRPAAPARPAQAQPTPGGAPFSNAARRLESLFPTR